MKNLGPLSADYVCTHLITCPPLSKTRGAIIDRARGGTFLGKQTFGAALPTVRTG